MTMYRDVSSPDISFIAPTPGTTITGTILNLIATASDDSGVANVAFYLGDPNATGAICLGNGAQGPSGTWMLSCTNPVAGTNTTLYARATDLAGNVADAMVSCIDLVAPIRLTCNLSTGDMYGSNVTTAGNLSNLDVTKTYQVSMYYQVYNATDQANQWVYVGSSAAIPAKNGGTWSITWSTDNFQLSGNNSANFIPIDINHYHAYSGIDIPNIGIVGKFNDTTNPIYAIIGNGTGNHYIYLYQQVMPGTGQWGRTLLTPSYSLYPAVAVASGDVNGDGLEEMFLATQHEILGLNWNGISWSLVSLCTMHGIADIAFDNATKYLYVASNNTVLVYHVTSLSASWFTAPNGPIATVVAPAKVRSIDLAQLETINGQETKCFLATDQQVSWFGSDHQLHDIDTGLSGVDKIKAGIVNAGSLMTSVVAAIHVGAGRSVVVAYENAGTVSAPAWRSRLVTDWKQAVRVGSIAIGINLAANINPSIVIASSQNVTATNLVGTLDNKLIAAMVSNNNPLYNVLGGTYNQYFIESIGKSTGTRTDYEGYEQYTGNSFSMGSQIPAPISAQGESVSITTAPSPTTFAESRWLEFNDNSGSDQPSMSYTMPNHVCLPGDTISFKFIDQGATPKGDMITIQMANVRDNPPFVMLALDLQNILWYGPPQVSVIAPYQLGVETTIQVKYISDTRWQLRVNNGSWSALLTSIGSAPIQISNIIFTGGGCHFYFNDIITSWAPGSAQVFDSYPVGTPVSAIPGWTSYTPINTWAKVVTCLNSMPGTRAGANVIALVDRTSNEVVADGPTMTCTFPARTLQIGDIVALKAIDYGTPVPGSSNAGSTLTIKGKDSSNNLVFELSWPGNAREIDWIWPSGKWTMTAYQLDAAMAVQIKLVASNQYKLTVNDGAWSQGLSGFSRASLSTIEFDGFACNIGIEYLNTSWSPSRNQAFNNYTLGTPVASIPWWSVTELHQDSQSALVSGAVHATMQAANPLGYGPTSTSSTMPIDTYGIYSNLIPGSGSVPFTGTSSTVNPNLPSSYSQGIQDVNPNDAVLYDGNNATGLQSQNNTIINLLPVYAPPPGAVTAELGSISSYSLGTDYFGFYDRSSASGTSGTVIGGGSVDAGAENGYSTGVPGKVELIHSTWSAAAGTTVAQCSLDLGLNRIDPAFDLPSNSLNPVSLKIRAFAYFEVHYNEQWKVHDGDLFWNHQDYYIDYLAPLTVVSQAEMRGQDVSSGYTIDKHNGIWYSSSCNKFSNLMTPADSTFQALCQNSEYTFNFANFGQFKD